MRLLWGCQRVFAHRRCSQSKVPVKAPSGSAVRLPCDHVQNASLRISHHLKDDRRGSSYPIRVAGLRVVFQSFIHDIISIRSRYALFEGGSS